MERDIGASGLENWTLRALGMVLEGSSWAAEEALSWGFGGGEVLGQEWAERVAMIIDKEERRWSMDWGL